MIAALLRTEGILCAYPETSSWSEGGPGTFGGTPGYEIRVAEADYERARELIEADESAPADAT
jgi:hypothetical protein